MDIVPDRCCRRCKTFKPIRDFSLARGRSDGLQVWCRTCWKSYRDAHRERIKASYQIYRAVRRPDLRQASRKYHAAHREQANECRRARRAAHLEEERAQSCAWHAEHLERARNYYNNHRDRATAVHVAWLAARPGYWAAWRAANPDQVRASSQKRLARKKGAAILGPVDYAQIRQRDHGMCWLCGETIAEPDLEFDHAIALNKGGEHSTRNIRMSHRKCNRRKKDRDIPHQRLLF